MTEQEQNINALETEIEYVKEEMRLGRRGDDFSLRGLEAGLAALREKAERENPTPLTPQEMTEEIYSLSADRCIEVCLVAGCEGDSVCIADTRIAGPKAWGGGRVIYDWKTSLRDLGEALRGIAIITPIAHKPKGEADGTAK